MLLSLIAGTLKFPPKLFGKLHTAHGSQDSAGRAGLGGLVLVRRAGVGAGRAASLRQASSSRHSDVRNNTSSCTNQQLTKGWVATE